ncbi:helix-turn-helix domain-containing protein [Myroides marinus]|uniref:helix-turn-helix domain-containing protein n=1 Tax=Myroides marinus TaxID=703342 RepID=UPI002577FA89|nr:AraC family transcriptional regulator [Myroides marinus]MDM1348849.1 helix-turn-helix transcriptional regulator [Myroides marinus]
MTVHDDLYGIQKSCYSQNTKTGEYFVKENGISYIVSGELEAFDGKTVHRYKKGDIVLYKKNTLIRFVKYAQPTHVFEAISVVFDDTLLQEYAQRYHICSAKLPEQSLYKVKSDILLNAYFTNLKSYFSREITPALAQLKKEEAIHLLLLHNKTYKNVLFHFATPGKIDLEAFMNNNFRFNVPLSQLAFLTGRSLATFKRDFEKMFKTSPNKWIQQKRLEEAYYLLENKKMKTKDVYLEVGFETLSHFSYAFKKHFGIPPSNV